MLIRLFVILWFVLLVSCDDSRKLDILSLSQPEKACAVNVLIEINEGYEFSRSQREDAPGMVPLYGDVMKTLKSDVSVLKDIDTTECAADVRAGLRDLILANESYIKAMEGKNLSPEQMYGVPIDLVDTRSNIRKSGNRLIELIESKYMKRDEDA